MSFLDEYTLFSQLGVGGFAKVYKVKHNVLGYVRAIRVLNDIIENEDSPTYKKFLKECSILLRLGNGNHPSIVQIYQPRLLQGKALVEMDYIEGKDLIHYLDECERFVPINEVMDMTMQISSALSYCHHDIYQSCVDINEDEKLGVLPDPEDGRKLIIDGETERKLVQKYKVIHNDIHSGNIMRRKNGNYVLLDFGLAIEGSEVVTSSKKRNGAMEYKSPEKWQNASVLTEQSDIYSFGAVMYEFLAGQVPFPYDKGNSNATIAEYNVMQAHLGRKPTTVFELRKKNFEAKYPGQVYEKDYPDWLEEAIMRCLEKDPQKRFANGMELYGFLKTQQDATSEDLRGLLEKKSMEIASLQGRLTEKDAKIAELTEKLNDATSEDLRGLLEKKSMEIALLQGRLTEKDAKIAELTEKLNDDTSEDLRGLLEKKSMEIDSLQGRLTEKDAKIASLKAKIKAISTILVIASLVACGAIFFSMKSEIDCRRNQIRDTQDVVDSKNMKIDSLKAENLQMRDQLSQRNSKIKQLNGKISDMNNRISDKEREISSLKARKSTGSSSAEVSSLKKQLSQKDSKIKQLNGKISDMNNRISDKEREISSLKARKSTGSSSAEVSSLKKQLSQKDSKIKQLERDKRALEETLGI